MNYYGLDVNAVWIVEEGETLSSKIQDLFGLRGAELTARVDEVAAKNGIADKDKINVGDVILLD